MPDRDRASDTLPWVLITVGVLGVLGLYLAFVTTEAGQAWDNALMDRADRPGTSRAAQFVIAELTPLRMVLLCGMACLTGLLRHWRVALGAAVGVTICLVVPQVLKATLPRPQLADPWPMPNSLPSGHTAAVAALTIALVLVLPVAWRRITLLLGAGATALMGAVVISLAHHRLSDVLASVCLALAAWGAGMLVQGSWQTEAPGRDGVASATPA